ncbi:MAG: hypothetical protein ABIG93_03365 [archaeon]
MRYFHIDKKEEMSGQDLFNRVNASLNGMGLLEHVRITENDYYVQDTWKDPDGRAVVAIYKKRDVDLLPATFDMALNNKLFSSSGSELRNADCVIYTVRMDESQYGEIKRNVEMGLE